MIGFVLENRRQNGLTWHERAEDLARTADIIRFNPVQDLGKPPKIITAEGVWHLRSLDTDGCRWVRFMGGLAEPVQRARQRNIHVCSEVSPGREIPTSWSSFCLRRNKFQGLQLLPVDFASGVRITTSHAIFDLVRRERLNLFPRLEPGLPFLVEGCQTKVLGFEPVSEGLQRNWIEVIIKRVCRNGSREFVPNVVGEWFMRLIFADYPFDFTPRPALPLEVIQTKIPNQCCLRTSILRPVSYERIPIRDL